MLLREQCHWPIKDGRDPGIPGFGKENTNRLAGRSRVYAVGEWQVDKAFERISDTPKLQNPRAPIGRSPLLGDRSKKK